MKIQSFKELSKKLSKTGVGATEIKRESMKVVIYLDWWSCSITAEYYYLSDEIAISKPKYEETYNHLTGSSILGHESMESRYNKIIENL